MPRRKQLPLLALAALLLSALACSRGDVGVTEVFIPSPTPTDITPSPTSVPPTPSPMPTARPTATSTPSEPEVPVSPTPPPTPTVVGGQEPETIVYEVQPGDTLRSIAVRYGVVPDEISTSQGGAPREEGLLDPATLLVIPRRLGPTGPSEKLIPDSEFVYSPHAVDFEPIKAKPRKEADAAKPQTVSEQVPIAK